MFIRRRKWTDGVGLSEGRNAGVVKVSILSALAVFFLFLILTAGVQKSTAVDCDCNLCHGDYHFNGNGWSGCSSCHDSPPKTGTHLIHYGNAAPQNLQYGDVTITSTADAYQFGCGNCHPLDPAKHRDGTVEVELGPAGAPAGSIKAKNPSGAAYTPGGTVTSYTFTSTINSPNGPFDINLDYSYTNGTCNNVYCHSGYTITSGSVGDPLVDSNGFYILDANGNLTYAPYTVTYSRVYKTTPPWGTAGTFSTCTECHDFPLTTSYPSVQAGVGDSHQWIDDYGYGNLHAFNMGFDWPISCMTCHYGTVAQPNTWTRDGMDVILYNKVPLASRVYHVNGTPDVIFDMTNPLNYVDTFGLSGATYDPATKTCSNVACHYNPTASEQLLQNKVKWGSPYRWWNQQECDLCHRIGTW